MIAAVPAAAGSNWVMTELALKTTGLVVMVPTPEPVRGVAVVNVIVSFPATVPSVVIVAMAVEATLTVTVTALGGVAPR